jgi:hypothetical protein
MGELMRRFVEQADRGQWTLLPGAAGEPLFLVFNGHDEPRAASGLHIEG